MAENARKPRKNINVPCLVLAIVFCLALIASICTYFYAASGTEIFTKVGFGATLQNSRIMADDENDMTFLGTYANTIIGVDAEGNHVWTSPFPARWAPWNTTRTTIGWSSVRRTGMFMYSIPSLANC